MPWSLRISFASLIVFAWGTTQILVATREAGWDSLKHLAQGSVIAAAGLITSLLCSLVCAAGHPPWRRLSLTVSVASVLLLAVLAIFAANA